MNTLLYGHNLEERIVAVQHIKNNLMRVYYRTGSSITTKSVEFYPFFFLSDKYYIEGLKLKHWIKVLEGNNYFRYLCIFDQWSDMWEAVHYLIGRYNQHSQEKINHYIDLPILYLRPDPINQFLLQTGRTLFKGMSFNELYRMQLKILTYTKTGYRYSNADRIEDRIIMVMLSDNNQWEYCIDGRYKSEKEMLEELIKIINEKNPDVLEGYKITTFDLPYLMKRCELFSIDFAIGRDNSLPRRVELRPYVLDWVGEYIPFEIAGRHVIDTYQLISMFDISDYKNVPMLENIRIKKERIPWYWDNDPEILKYYLLNIINNIKSISEQTLPYLFYMSKIIPFNLNTLLRVGLPTIIESLLLREYLNKKHSVPYQDTNRHVINEYSEIFYTGVFNRIIEIDLESFYPMLLNNEKILPEKDSLNALQIIFESIDLLKEELLSKTSLAKSEVEVQNLKREYFSLSMLTKYIYNYITSGNGLFNDYRFAVNLNLKAREKLLMFLDLIRTSNGIVIEVNPNSIFLVPPKEIKNEDEENRYVSKLSEQLALKYNLSIKGRYKKMLSYRIKNHALVTYDDKIRIKGNALLPRNIEKFGKFFIEQCIEALLDDNIKSIHSLYVSLYRDISERKLNIMDFARTETLKVDLKTYLEEVKNSLRHKTAAYEVAISSGRSWKVGDKISYYITGNDTNVKEFEDYKLAEDWDPNFPDENIPYYIGRLKEFAKKFEIFFAPKDFHAIFSNDDLFPFSAEGIKINNLPVPK